MSKVITKGTLPVTTYGGTVLGHPQGETPYQKGFQAGKYSWKNQKNPFDAKMWEHNRWQDGYNDGLKEREPDVPKEYPYWYC